MFNRKLGKKEARLDARNLKGAKYMKALPTPPVSIDWSHITNLGVMLNDNLGDCVCAAYGHDVQQWNQYAGHPFIPADNDVLKSYEAIGGYVPGDDSTDNGCDMLTACKYWRNTGLAGHKVAAFVQLNPQNPVELKQAIALFGNVYLGYSLPLTAQNQTSLWFIDDSDPNLALPGSWGGHCVPGVAYDASGLSIVTWGALQKVTWHFTERYADEAYALLSPDWIEQDKKSPSGFDLATLQADLAAL